MTFFSPSQQRVISDVMAEASELVGRSAWELEVSAETALRLGLVGPVTFHGVLVALIANGDKTWARAFVKAVLTLRQDCRVQGEEVPGPPFAPSGDCL
jgi:hypothetical protein